MADDFSERYGDLLTGSYDCVDRIVLNAYYPMGHGPGGFRVWWRKLHNGREDQLDDNHLMRMAGRFARRVKAWGAANGVPVIYCKSGERKHRIAEEYLAAHDPVRAGVFLVLVAKAPATVWQVHRSAAGVIGNIAKKYSYVNHYSFHIMDPEWGHVTIKMSGHPPFAAQVMLNGHEFVACQARAAGIDFRKDGNCFTAVAVPNDLARVADTLSQPATAGRLSQVCNRWIYTACLCFGLDSDEVARSGFAEQVRVMTGQSTAGYSTRHASYDLRKIRGKHLVDKPGRTRRYHVPPDAARTIAALLTLRDQVIAPIVAGVRSPRMGRKPITWTPVERDYETLRIDLQTLFTHLGITTTQAAAA